MLRYFDISFFEFKIEDFGTQHTEFILGTKSHAVEKAQAQHYTRKLDEIL